MCFGFFIEGSTEEEEQLQAVAEDVAASVLHPCSPPNPNLHAEDVSSHENIEDCDVQNNLIDVMCRNKTLVILFTYSSVFVFSSFSQIGKNNLHNEQFLMPLSFLCYFITLL